MDRLLKIILYAIPGLAMAGLVVFIMRPDMVRTGPRKLLTERLEAGAAPPCPQYDHIHKAITSGGPPKDGIPAIDHPQYVHPEEAQLLANEPVLGVAVGGFVSAYPLRIMTWHEVVNQEYGDLKLSVSYCPLARSSIGFIGRSLGVTGTLYNSNLILYDRASQSRIPQILGRGIDGPLCALALPTFPVHETTWGKWLALHPQSLVMTADTGYKRDYDTDPYEQYHRSDTPLFSLTIENPSLPAKSMVFGVEFGGESAAVVVDGFQRNHPDGLEFLLGGGIIRVWHDETLGVLRAGDDVRQMESHWFAWFAQHPETRLIM